MTMRKQQFVFDDTLHGHLGDVRQYKSTEFTAQLRRLSLERTDVLLIRTIALEDIHKNLQ